ncbi:DNA polymerase (family 10) [Hydrogenivirga caldilitoris]|uniref:DNA polymerase beta n=1 Tax=Hydrogenivirga caldilitoris TaxID=246264 RepID=A0A497XNP0_9AQUI|nr:DNA polymerase/3'-5' exonuclease PolX [Hydrogenivirga caldilitoris]RLJ70557.1 DNA polymerase (family 10) [Hydrogenivirga caldilitoris]
MHKNNKELARIFEKIADILEFLGDNIYRVNTYRRAANLISELPDDIEELYKRGKLSKLPGIGSSTVLKIEEFLRTGTVKKYEDLRKKVPEDLLELMDVPGIGPKTLKVAYEKLNVRTKEDFLRVLKDGSLAKLPGFGSKKVENILKGIELWKSSQERISLLDAYPIAQELLEYMKKEEAIKDISVAGSLRRMKETIGDIDILVSADRKDWSKIHEHFVKYMEVDKILAKGETKSSVVLRNGRQADLRTVEPLSWGAALQYFTGSKEHNVRVRDIAKEKGLKVNEYGVFRADTEERLGGETEEEVYELVGMQWVPPEIRENWGEIELALEGKLPKLIEFEEIKGDFHVHTNWSDGINPIEEVVEHAYRLGYSYIVIGDHSQSARVANGLTPERYLQQWKLIDKLNELYNPKGFYILKGCEVDILPDGSLDLPNELLEGFDFVVASIHSRFNQDNTYRILKAMENPYVNLIGHPTGKAYGQREGYPLDMDKVIEFAKETGTALEINTFRIDLSPENIRRCVERGVTMAVVTDAHSVTHLSYIRIGVGIARRGWAPPELILNTKDLKQVRDFVQRKRKNLARAK